VRVRSKSKGTLTLRLNLLYFASLREVTGVSSEIIYLANKSTLAELVTEIGVIHPGLIDLNFQVAVNRRMAAGRLHLQDEDEIAIFPPVTGG